ncbi:MAG: glycosyltransferase family 2 protein, partial [Deltaproteobacteria bacterium]|nr:glycosyltransferase family 2 protein [Deltaproteobacteria bacterium]
MAEAPRVLVAVPLYNHGATLPAVVDGVLALGLEVLVVDDGSTDGGADALAGRPVRVLRHGRNRGKGAAILTAAAEARRLGMTHLVTLDADGQHDPADLPRFLEALGREPGAIFVGKRDFEGTHAPRSSRFGRSFSNFWMRLQTGVTVGDVQSGFRAYPLAVLEHLKLRETAYSFEVEVLVKAAWAGVEVRDVPISVYYAPGRERVSHFRLFRDNARLTALNTRLTMRSFLPWPHRKLVETKGPTVSLLHPLRSLRELLTENASPGQLAAAGAVG